MSNSYVSPFCVLRKTLCSLWLNFRFYQKGHKEKAKVELHS